MNDLNKPYFDAKLLITLITILEAKWYWNKNKESFFLNILPIEKSIKPTHRTVFEWAKPNKINEGISTKMPYTIHEERISIKWSRW